MEIIYLLNNFGFEKFRTFERLKTTKLNLFYHEKKITIFGNVAFKLFRHEGPDGHRKRKL